MTPTKSAESIASSMGRRRPAPAPVVPAPARTTAAAPTGPVSRLSVDLPKDTMKRLKMLSVERDTTIRELVIEMIDERLSSRD